MNQLKNLFYFLIVVIRDLNQDVTKDDVIRVFSDKPRFGNDADLTHDKIIFNDEYNPSFKYAIIELPNGHGKQSTSTCLQIIICFNT